MAKKKAPMKTCPECGTANHARKRECKCGYMFPKSAAKATKPTKAINSVDYEKEAMRFVLANKGNTAAVLKLIEEYKQPVKSKLEQFMDSVGGIDNAKKIVEELGESLK